MKPDNENCSTILIVDDEEDLLRGLTRALKRRLQRVKILTSTGGAETLKMLKGTSPDLVLLDVMMREMDGLEVLDRLQQYDPDLTVIMMTAYGSIELAVDAMRRGAWDFVTKPLDLDALARMVQKGMERNRLLRDNRRLLKQVKEMESPAEFIGESDAMLRLYHTIETVAASDYTVLVRGASGTGKELVTRELHRKSKRKDKPLIMVNCPAIPEQLLESELFGHRRGAFTGADHHHDGMFLQANGGTICLDEIGDLPIALQTKLLRVLQNREIKALGANNSQPVDVRILASTNQNLEEKISRNTFREDLFYRLNVVNIHTPTLEEIREDIPLLASHFLKLACAELECEPKMLNPAALELLANQNWPGNIRQLQNVIRRAATFCHGKMLTPTHFKQNPDFEIKTKQGPESDEIELYKKAREDCLNSFTVKYVTRLLRKTSGNVSRSARLSGLSRVALQKIMQRQGISAQPFKNK